MDQDPKAACLPTIPLLEDRKRTARAMDREQTGERTQEDPMIKSFIITIILLVISWALFEVTKVQSMNDEERKKYGHGPKGQGK